MLLDKGTLASMEGAARECIAEGEGWQWGPFHPEGGFESVEAVVSELTRTARGSEGDDASRRELWGVHMPDPIDPTRSIVMCHTGNGPTSKAHAKMFSVAPRAILALIAEVRRLRGEPRS